VGNSGVPYPYAVDEDGRYYLMVEDVIIDKVPNIIKFDNGSYGFYYTKSEMTNINNSDNNNMLNIKHYYIDNKPYSFRYKVLPNKDYDRISSWDDFGEGMKIEYNDGTVEKINKKKYAQLHKKIGKEFGFSRLLTKMIQARLE
jgi:hypothetical protein